MAPLVKIVAFWFARKCDMPTQMTASLRSIWVRRVANIGIDTSTKTTTAIAAVKRMALIGKYC